jgi:TatD DNase family protein
MIISPAESDYIDIHSHSKKPDKDVFRILNIFSRDYNELPNNQALSVGLHPWHINDTSTENLQEILQHSALLSQVKAIGETGLDRIISISLEKQEEVFITHIKIASEYNKPLIIHCVKAYSEMVRIKNKFQANLGWIIHGFDGNLNIAEELVAKGFYISLGPRLLKNKIKTAKIKEFIPVGKIFIETDEDKTLIRNLYLRISELYSIDVSDLQKIIRENYFKVFKQ